MNKPPQVGSVFEKQFKVEPQHLIDFADRAMPPVLCTPALVGFLERTAREALIPCLEPGENSVGTEVDVQHLAPTPPGQTVTCTARIIRVEGVKVDFHIEARDEQELIARCQHRRFILKVERFAQAVRKKTTP